MQNPDVSKKVEPQIYSILLEGKGVMFMSMQFAYSLEDAFSMAQNEFLKQNPINATIMQGATIKLFAIKTIDQLFFEANISKGLVPSLPKFEKELDNLKKEFNQITTPMLEEITPVQEVKEVVKEVVLTKNELMKKIIDDKDQKLLKISKNIFTKNEMLFLKQKIKSSLDK